MESEPMHPEWTEAQQTLANALEEACRADLDNLDTGELIRIDEALEVASKATKDALSTRQRLRNEGEKSPLQKPAALGTIHKPLAHRVFQDAGGRRWHAFAVQNASESPGRRALPDAFRDGWLVFESGDELRRFAPVPNKWEDFSVDELRELCQKAFASSRRRSSAAGDQPLKR